MIDFSLYREQLDKMGFFTAPASTRYHGAYEGGLYDHSLKVMDNLMDLTERMGLVWQREESPYIIGMFHDLCKCDQYERDDDGKWQYRKDTLLKGHGVKSAMLAGTLLTLTEEEVACITYHMGAFVDKEEWADYTRAIHMWPNVLWTHTADMMAAHMQEEGLEGWTGKGKERG